MSAKKKLVKTSPKTTLVLFCGLPGSGKTTIAKRLANEIPAVRLCPDEWMADLGIDLFDEETRDKLEKRFWKLSQDLLRHGQSVILESGFWLRSDRDEKRLAARTLGVAVGLHYLEVPIDELVKRVKARNENAAHGTVPISRKQLEEYATVFQAPDAAELSLFDPLTKQ